VAQHFNAEVAAMPAGAARLREVNALIDTDSHAR